MSPTSISTPTEGAGGSTRRALLDAYLAGYEAYLQGQSPSTMPYTPSIDPKSRCRAWHTGYVQSKADRADENRAAAHQ